MNNRSNDYILAKYDVSGIQSYIFATNRLRENAGASYQVTRVLEEFLPEAIEEEQTCLTDKSGNAEIGTKIGNTKTSVTAWENQDSLSMPDDECIQAEIIYIGGGNAVVLYRSEELCTRVSQNLSKRMAKECQGIYLAAACINSKLLNFKEDIDKLNQKLAENKRNMVRQPIFSPFPVVERDNAAHQPITHRIHYNEVNRPDEDITEIQYQKRGAYRQMQRWWSAEKASRRWSPSQDTQPNRQSRAFHKLYPKMEGGAGYDYPDEMYKLCRKQGDDSYIAVVHIDGNGMGQQVKEVLSAYEEYFQGVPAIRQKSKEISRLFSKAYEEVLRKLWRNSDLLIIDKERGGDKVFPLRPIILDGDDFTFLCMADLAIPIAAGFLTQLSEIQKGKKNAITACAGIAFVHSHFPFYQAYLIAEESCSRAKAKWYKEKRDKEQGTQESYLDFQVISESEIGAFDKDDHWKLRPYSVLGKDKVQKSGTLKYLYDTLKEMEENWPSNRLHKIYRAIQDGKEQVELLAKEFKSRGYQIDSLTGSCVWNESPLFDALEIRGMCQTTLLKEFMYIQDEVS